MSTHHHSSHSSLSSTSSSRQPANNTTNSSPFSFSYLPPSFPTPIESNLRSLHKLNPNIRRTHTNPFFVPLLFNCTAASFLHLKLTRHLPPRTSYSNFPVVNIRKIWYSHRKTSNHIPRMQFHDEIFII